MGAIHNLVAFGDGGLRGIQANQRDWSPFVAHFTSFAAMKTIRDVFREGLSAKEARKLLDAADERSFEVCGAIAGSGTLRASHPAQMEALPACVCFSECALPGLLGHCERYGRFGWVFRKDALFDLGARPCVYVGAEEHEAIRGAAEGAGDGPDATNSFRRLFGLANVLRPAHRSGERVQDFTHEREWRVFGDLELAACPPVALIAPAAFATRMRALFPDVAHLVPIDLLHEWGL